MKVETREVIVAVEQAIGRLCRGIPSLHSHVARRAIRIEADHDATYAILHGADHAYRGELMPKEGPRRLHGVDLYLVHDLPAPGWRIVDPFAGA